MTIEVQNITKKMDNNIILDKINFTFESGQIYGLKGKNGSGKTMLMRALCGLIKLDAGEIVIDGKVLRKDISFPPSIGVLIESPGFISSYSGYENLKTLISIQNRVEEKAIVESMNSLGLDPYEKKAFKKYSLGMKQKLGIAAAIVESPDIIILDEPTNALDEKSIGELKKILAQLKNEKKLIIMSCHDTEELEEITDIIIEMKMGHIEKIYDSPKRG